MMKSGLAAIGAGFDRISISLGVTMAIGYGTLFYSFAILAPAIVADTGWTRSFVYSAFSLALLAGSLTAPLAGRMIDRHGGRLVLSAGSALAALALVALSTTSSKLAFVAALFAVEATAMFVQYEAGFAALTRIRGHGARPGISAVTLIAGFSSTIFWPLCSLLEADYGWRGAYLGLALVNLLIAMPLHLSLPAAAKASRQPADDITSGNERYELPASRRGLGFAALAVAFAAGGFAISAVQSTFALFFANAGYGLAAAAGFGALIGPTQVAARIADILAGRFVSPLVIGLGANLCLFAGIAALLALSAGPVFAVVFAVFFGIGQGLAYIQRGVVPLALFGPQGYGTLTGKLSAIRIVVAAAGPASAAFLSERYGDPAAISVIAVFAIISIAGLAALLPLATTRPSR